MNARCARWLGFTCLVPFVAGCLEPDEGDGLDAVPQCLAAERTVVESTQDVGFDHTLGSLRGLIVGTFTGSVVWHERATEVGEVGVAVDEPLVLAIRGGGESLFTLNIEAGREPVKVHEFAVNPEYPGPDADACRGKRTVMPLIADFDTSDDRVDIRSFETRVELSNTSASGGEPRLVLGPAIALDSVLAFEAFPAWVVQGLNLELHWPRAGASATGRIVADVGVDAYDCGEPQPCDRRRFEVATIRWSP